MEKGISNVFVIKKNLIILMKNVIDKCKVIISQFKKYTATNCDSNYL